MFIVQSCLYCLFDNYKNIRFIRKKRMNNLIKAPPGFDLYINDSVNDSVPESVNVIVTDSASVTGNEPPVSGDEPEMHEHGREKIIKDFKVSTFKKSLFSTNYLHSTEMYSAGILPFHVKSGTIYFLLGKDPDGKWSDFGGRSETSDEGRWDMTAAREFYEETIGSVMDINMIRTRLENKNKYLKIKDKTLNGYPYYMYVLTIPFKDIYRNNFRSTYSFIKYVNNMAHKSKNDARLYNEVKSYNEPRLYNEPMRKIEYKYLEKIDIQWITLDTLKKSLTQDTEYPLRSIFKRTLQGNLNQIINFCSTYQENVLYPFY